MFGAHGSTFRPYRSAEIVQWEEMNPMLYISVPKALRADKYLQAVLQKNSKLKTLIMTAE